MSTNTDTTSEAENLNTERYEGEESTELGASVEELLARDD